MTRRARLEAGWLWFGLLCPALVPLVAPYPPFQDWPAHVGVVGALANLDEPAARMATFYSYSGWWKLNMLFYLPAWGLSGVLGPVAAANLCLAVALGGLGPAMWLLCRSVGADERMALLAGPLAIGRHVYCGFGPNAAALPLLLTALASFFLVRRGARWAAVGLAASLITLAFMHAFVFLAGAGLLLLLVLGDALYPPRRAALAGLVALMGAGAVFAVLAGQGLGVDGAKATSGPGVVAAVVWAVQTAPRDQLPETFWGWLFASYRYRRLDDLCQVAWLTAVLAALMLSWSLEGRRWWSSPRAALFGLAAVAGLMFCVLPENVGPPVNWWGARLRLPAIVGLLLLPALGRRVGAELGPFVPAAGLVSVATVGLALADLAAFHRHHTAGLAPVIASMPEGQRISAIHYTPREVHEYPGEPFGYFGNFYMASKGGVVPQDFFERREYPLQRRRRRTAPPWGMAEAFRWAAHGPGFDGFLVKTDPARPDAPFAPLGTTDDRVELVTEKGGWRYYRFVGAVVGGDGGGGESR